LQQDNIMIDAFIVIGISFASAVLAEGIHSFVGSWDRETIC
jgi:hypothetical protein